MIDVLAISHASFTAVNRAIYRELARRGWSVGLVIPSQLSFPGGVRSADPASAQDPPLHVLRPSRESPRLSTFEGLRRVLAEQRPKIVLLDNDPNSRIAVELGLWCRLNRAALVCQSCENLTRRWLPAFRRAGRRGLAGAALVSALGLFARPNVAHVFVISDAGRRVLREQGFRRVTKIPLGMDTALFKPDEEARGRIRAALGLTEVTVAYFGRIHEAKGVHLLVDALSGLRSRPFQLLLDDFSTYRGAYEACLADLITRHGLGSRVVRFDARHDEMPAYMNAADIVAVPSISTPTWKEQYGRVAPEAMACGRAVVISDSGALPELVGDAGVCVPEGDVDALRAAIAELMGDPERRRLLGEAATARAHAELSVAKQADIMEAVLGGLR